MRRNGATLGVACVLTLAGCGMALPVQGTLERTGDRFNGEATGYVDGLGHLEITFASGRTCSGSFSHVSPVVGQGVIQCSDGSTGQYTFVFSGQHATGAGALNGYLFTFTFG